MKDGPDVAMTVEMIYAVARMANLIPLADAQAVLDEVGRMEKKTLMPILDPTAYMKIRANIPGNERAIRTFITFRSELEKITQAEQAAAR